MCHTRPGCYDGSAYHALCVQGWIGDLALHIEHQFFGQDALAENGQRPGRRPGRRRFSVEHRALQTAGLLTEWTRSTLWQAQHGQPRHVAAREPGELVCLDTFYIGQLKGVGKVWQITGSYGVAGLLPAHTAAAAAHFLRRVVLPLYRRAGWRLR